LIVISQAANWQDYVNASPAQLKIEPTANTPGFNSTGGFAVKKDAAYTTRERAWISAQKSSVAHSAPTPAWALAKALKESGLAKGTLAVDDMRIAYLLDQIGMTDVKCLPGEKIFQKIRMVKSEAELALQRIGGRNNAVAAMNTIRSIEKGMTFAEIDRRFRTEAAALGNETQSFIAGVSLALLPDGITVPGKPFLIDAVSHFNQYHGDFGRTIVIGEPSKEILAREKAHKIGRDAVFEIVATHCVGLAHDDNPTRLDVPFNAPYDHVLEQNMVLTIDLANVEIGWGACHHEDLFRVTKTGFEFMAPPGDPLVVV
jgi:Xaa-Pro aminopeptidase